MKRFAYAIISIVLCAASPSVSAQELISGGLSRDSVLIGDQVEWTARFRVPKELTMDFDSLSNPVVQGVEVISHFRLDTLKKRGGTLEVEARAIITSFDSGSYMLPDRVFYFYRDGEEADTIHLDGMRLAVNTIPIDTATFEMADIRPLFRYPVTFGEIMKWVGIVLGILVLVAAGVIIYRRRKENLSIWGKPKVVDPPHIVALRTLEKIRGEQLWQNKKQKQYYTAITDVLRLYMEGRFSIQAMESTTKEILDALSKQDIKPEEYDEIETLFTRADLVKFAKFSSTPEEDEGAIPVAVRFVNSTFLREIEEEKKASEDKKEGGLK